MKLGKKLKRLKRRIRSLVRKPYVPGEHPDDHLGWLMTPELLNEQTLKTQAVISKVVGGGGLGDALRGFDGRRFGERIAEYPYFADWYLRAGAPTRLLDVGCVLNNPAVAGFLAERVSSMWFCNPAVEPLASKRPTYYHVSKLDAAFPGGETFPAITCLSTIEHIGYDNSQYGSTEAAVYPEPSDQPLLDAFEKIGSLLSPGGRSLISVPYGCRAVNIHRVTKKPAFQSFDWASAEAVLKHAAQLGMESRAVVYAGNAEGWHALEDPASYKERYGNGFPGSPAVLLIESIKTH